MTRISVGSPDRVTVFWLRGMLLVGLIATRQTIGRLFDSGRKLVYEFTGAGSLAMAWLHSVGGSSRLLLEACDRYSPRSLAELLGKAPATDRHDEPCKTGAGTLS